MPAKRKSTATRTSAKTGEQRGVPVGGRKVGPPTRRTARAKSGALVIPDIDGDVQLPVEDTAVKLTNLAKPFWVEEGISKRDLLQYYADVAPALLPHLRDRAMVMKR